MTRLADLRASFRFPLEDARARRALLEGGLWMLALPLGWTLAMGYRAEVGFRQARGRRPLLPAWSGRRLRALADGSKVTLVMIAAYAPYAALALALGVTADTPPARLVPWAALLVVVPPVSLPLVPAWLDARAPWYDLAAPEAALLAAVFAATTFACPALFLEVAREGRFAAAFRPARALAGLRDRRRAYARAWGISLVATGCALLALPLLPWSLFWSYLVIVHAFGRCLDAPAGPGPG